MSEVTEDRFCVICEQIVPREQKGVSVKISPSRTILLHEGCGLKVYDKMRHDSLREEEDESTEPN